jgi:cytochrome b subunit of formate dehydrogenase
MTPLRVRQLLHHGHVVAALLLLATGWLIAYPELRARLLPGRDRLLDETHLWTGFAFVALPALALALGARPLVRELGRRFGPPDPWGWRRAHLALTLGASVALAASGVALWRGELLSQAAEDAAFLVHEWTTWILAATIPIHLVASRRKIVSRYREIVLRERPPLFEFADGEEEDV